MTWDNYIGENLDALRGIGEAQISEFVRHLRELRQRGQRLWILGNGGSASTASHAAGDFGKTAKRLQERPLNAFALSEMVALQTAYSNDVSFEEGFASTLRDFSEQGDAIWIISVSGSSPNLLRAVEQARRDEVKILSVVGRKGSALSDASDAGIVIDSLDYQVVENIQLILMHWFTKELSAVD